jgi:cell division protein FtsQ
MIKAIRNFFSHRLKRKVQVFLTFVILLGLIGFVEKKQVTKVCTKVNISIENYYDSYFINEDDVLELITKGGAEKTDWGKLKILT